MINSQYLSEDEDLLAEVEKVGPPSTGMAEAGQMHQLASIQIRASLRNRKTAHDLDESMGRYSIILIIFALAQIIFAVFEFLFSATTSPHPILGDFTIIAAVILAVWAGWSLLNDYKKKRK